MAFFISLSDYRPKGKALFVYEESPTVHFYSVRPGPWQKVGYIIIGGMILLSGLFIFYVFDGCWSNIGQSLKQKLSYLSWKEYLVLLWPLVFIFTIPFRRLSAHDHGFYANVAQIYRGSSKRPYRWILPEEVEYVEVEKVHYRHEVFYIFTVQFKSLKSKFLGRPSNLRFGSNGNTDIKKLEIWAKERGIPFRSNLVAQEA